MRVESIKKWKQIYSVIRKETKTFPVDKLTNKHCQKYLQALIKIFYLNWKFYIMNEFIWSAIKKSHQVFHIN